MKTNDPITGKKISWTFSDGEMKGKTFEHTFGTDGTVRFTCKGTDKMNGSAHYELSKVNDDVYAVSYAVPGGATLTTVLDTKTHDLVAFSSMKDQTATHHGSFEIA